MMGDQFEQKNFKCEMRVANFVFCSQNTKLVNCIRGRSFIPLKSSKTGLGITRSIFALKSSESGDFGLYAYARKKFQNLLSNEKQALENWLSKVP